MAPEELPPTGPLAPREPTEEQRGRLMALLEALEDLPRVLVLTHDNPDPDALAAAAGLGFLLERVAGVEPTLAFGGIVGRAENRALIQEMPVQFRRIETLEGAGKLPVALVDTQPRSGNNSLPAGRIASVILDHHPMRPETEVATFADVRPGYGASASMVVEYLRAAELEPERWLATSLFYGVQSETMDLGRDVSPADVDASLFLYPRSDPAAIARIRHARVPRGYLRSLHAALTRARRHGPVAVVPLGGMDYPDMVAEIADLFMHVEGVEWTVAVGRYGQELLLSLRTYDPRAHAGRLVRKVIGDRGSAGGHGGLAGGRINVRSLAEEEAAALRDELLRELLAELDAPSESSELLL
ncbi:MAG: bifunctional oligoribonuclease/PAP phosphatase NrnA [Gemmatimonadota bacterium]